MPDRKLFGALNPQIPRDLSQSFGRLQAELNEGLLRRALRVKAIRPDDLLVLEFAFDNLAARGGGGRRVLSRIDGAKPARLIAFHQPLAIGEGAHQEEPFQPGPHPPFNAPSRLAGESRVAATMPVEVQTLDWSLASFLTALSQWPLALDYAARPDPRGARPRPPRWSRPSPWRVRPAREPRVAAPIGIFPEMAKRSFFSRRSSGVRPHLPTHGFGEPSPPPLAAESAALLTSADFLIASTSWQGAKDFV